MNLTYVSGTQPFGPGSQMCVDLSINDDQLVEQTETFVVCGCPTPLAVIPEANRCVNVTILDNDGKIQYPDILMPMFLFHNFMIYLVVAKFQFSQPSHDVSEDIGVLGVCLELISGILTEDVVIEVTVLGDGGMIGCKLNL